MNKFFLSYFLLLCISLKTSAETSAQKISSFELKSNSSERLSVRTLANTEELNNNEINGSFDFSINGIDKKLQFKNGEAIIPEKISSSTFLFIRPLERPFSGIELYYVLKVREGLSVIHIPIVLLLLIPLFFFVLGYFVRKLLIIAIALIVVFFIFNKGLSIGDYLHVIYQWIFALF